MQKVSIPFERKGEKMKGEELAGTFGEYEDSLLQPICAMCTSCNKYCRSKFMVTQRFSFHSCLHLLLAPKERKWDLNIYVQEPNKYGEFPSSISYRIMPEKSQ